MDGGLDDEAMRAMQRGDDSTQMGERETGQHMEQAPLLFDSLLRGLRGRAQASQEDKRTQSGTEKSSPQGVLQMSGDNQTSEAPQGQESAEQRPEQSGSVMPDVPQGRPYGGWDVGHIWLQEPDIPRVAKGVPERVNRLKALGNAVVPQIPELIARRLLETL
jgi:hypothetical protein